MHYRRLLWLIIAGFASTDVYGQGETTEHTVEVHGKVINANTNEAVEAKIKYESIPYGSEVGIFKGSNFTFLAQLEKDYRVTVQAQGFIPYSGVFPKTETTNFAESKDLIINLIPNGIGQLIRLDKLIFDIGDADISVESYEELNNFVKMMEDNPNMEIQLEGHTDFRGNARKNMKLSQKRVEAVKKFLTKRGIDRKRIKTKAFGGTQPLSREEGDKARSQNRRVEVRILKN